MNHLSFIADGNRRWAKKNNLPSEVGYVQGLTTIEKLSLECIKLNIPFLSFFCFSTENWGRAEHEVRQLFELAESYFLEKSEWYKNNGIKVIFYGRRDRFTKKFVEMIEKVEKTTAGCSNLTLIIMADYGGKNDITQAFQSGAKTEDEIESYFNLFFPNPDAIVRTGGQKRLSNYMLWQAAYAELYFVEEYFPDFDEEKLREILQIYNNTVKNYGK